MIHEHLIKEKCKIALCARSFNELQVASDELKKQDSSVSLSAYASKTDIVDESLLATSIDSGTKNP